MEKTLQYLSRPMRKSFYFQSEVSVWRAVLHGQTPYQHCDSSMQYHLQDQRFQKILMSAYRHHLKSSLPLRQHKLKFSECILKLWIPPDFQWQPKPLPASPCLLHQPLCYPCWGRSEDVHEWDQEADLPGGLSFLQLDQAAQSCSCPAGTSQGCHRVEKNRQKKGASAYVNLSTSTTYKTKV